MTKRISHNRSAHNAAIASIAEITSRRLAFIFEQRLTQLAYEEAHDTESETMCHAVSHDERIRQAVFELAERAFIPDEFLGKIEVLFNNPDADVAQVVVADLDSGYVRISLESNLKRKPTRLTSICDD